MTCKSLQDQSFVISESEVLKLIVIYAEGYKIFFLNEEKYRSYHSVWNALLKVFHELSG